MRKKRLSCFRDIWICNILLLVISVLFIFVSVFFVASISTQASDKEHMPSYKYFRSIEISSGDTLWSIAEDNMDARYYRHTADYVAEVKRMNPLEKLFNTTKFFTLTPICASCASCSSKPFYPVISLLCLLWHQEYLLFR